MFIVLTIKNSVSATTCEAHRSRILSGFSVSCFNKILTCNFPHASGNKKLYSLHTVFIFWPCVFHKSILLLVKLPGIHSSNVKKIHIIIT